MKVYLLYSKKLMRVTILCFSILTTVGLLTVGATSSGAQVLDSRISIDLDTKNLYAALKKLEKQAHVVFAYDENYLQLKQQKIAPAKFRDLSLRSILNVLFTDAGISFREEAGNILLTKKISKKATGKVSGKVTDEKGEPLPGASILVAGTSTGASTDANGNYSLELEEGSYTLVASYIGFSAKEFKDVVLKDGENYVLDIQLNTNTVLQEVVVSYGVQKQREVTGSIVQIDAPALQDQPVGQFAQQLQGKVAGVQINQYSGQPGRGLGFRIRGAASLFADNQPLVVIDGLPITGSINNINPAEIETITVLKDASSTSLYGSRAANGVILITTRHAKPGDSKIEFNAFYGLQKDTAKQSTEDDDGT